MSPNKTAGQQLIEDSKALVLRSKELIEQSREIMLEFERVKQRCENNGFIPSRQRTPSIRPQSVP
jgi:hypothetical protein